MTQKGSEKRIFPRVMVRVLVDFEGSDTYLYDYSSNLSEGGIFIETQQPLPIGEALTLRFTLPNVDRVFEASGKVAWTQKNEVSSGDGGMTIGPGMGIQFETMDEVDRKMVTDYIRNV